MFKNMEVFVLRNGDASCMSTKCAYSNIAYRYDIVGHPSTSRLLKCPKLHLLQQAFVFAQTGKVASVGAQKGETSSLRYLSLVAPSSLVEH